MRIAVFTKNFTNPAYSAARLGAERAAAVFGDEVIHFVPIKGDDPIEQCELIERALSLNHCPDAFVLSPVHRSKVDEAITKVALAKIPMIGFVNPIHASKMVSYVGSDDYQLALSISRYLFQNLCGRGRILVVSGPEDSYTSLERLRGFHLAAKEESRIEFIGQLAGDYSREVAAERTAVWLRKNKAPDAVLVANDIMAIGVLDALEAKGQTAKVVGVNAIPQAIEAIAAGRMLATADFNAMQMAYLATECAARYLRGESVPSSIELGVKIVDQGNSSQWNLPYEHRPVITLEQLRRNT